VKRPTSYPTDAFSELESAVSRGGYRRFDDLSAVPSALSRVAAFPAPENFRTSVLMASSSTQTPPTIGGLVPASSAPVYRVSAVRADRHGPVGEPHLNKDDVLIFKDRSGKPWQLYAHDQPGHYRSLSADAGLDVVLETYNWPRAQTGSLKSLSANGALVDFSTGGWPSGAA
jgi:hypothetical protein